MRPKLTLTNLDATKDEKPAQKLVNDFGHIIKNFQIDPYRVQKLDEIGKGSQGQVFTVKISGLPGTYAMKEVIMTDKDEIRHLQNELDILRQCDHRNIVKFVGINVIDVKVQIFMEYMDFGSLGFLVKFKGALQEIIVSVIACQILEGLDYLHRGKEKVAHRDLKPGNILLNKQGEVKIADFGIARKVIGTNGEMGTYIGTNLYMSPERLNGRYAYNSKCDIWSFGIIVFECALGKFPFEDDIKANKIKEYQFAEFLLSRMKLSFPDHFSPHFKDFLTKCLEVNVEQRAKAAELLQHPFIVKARAIPLDLFKAYLGTVLNSMMEKFKTIQPSNEGGTGRGK